MILSRRRAVVAASITLAAVASALAVGMIRHHSNPPGPRPAAERPPLLLLTSLPLLFGEDFSLKGGGSPALATLRTRYRVLPISVTDRAELSKARLLLMAQPQAQTAENLVALDDWVRGGGHLLLFADPLLEWPSKRPLGDPLRPPPVFADTGLLAHWGLRLDPPDRRGPAVRNLDGFDVLTVSPGVLSGACKPVDGGLAARCRIGSGEAIVIADADLLNVSALGAGARHNLDAVLEELANLEQ